MSRNLNTYSYPINVIADYLKIKKLKFSKDNVLSETELSQYEGKEDITHLFEYFIKNYLTIRQVQVIKLYYKERLSVKKISSQMELPVPNVTQHRRNALRCLFNSDFSYILLFGLEGLEKRDYEKVFAEGYDKGYKEGYNDGFHDYVKDRGFRERQGNAPLQSLNDLPQMLIEDMDLPPRVYHSCEFRGIRTLRELACLSPEEVFNIRNVGIKTYMIVVDILSKYGINKEPYIIEFQKHNKSDYVDTNINDKNADN